MKTYTPFQFFNQYFLTPPYPASLEMMVFGPLNDEQTGGSSNTQASINYWSQVAALADKYPAVEMQFMVAFDMSNSSQWTLFQQFVSALSSHTSVYSVGIEGEYAKGKTLPNMQQAMSIVHGGGKTFVNYLVDPSVVPAGGYIIGHTNFPGGDAGGGTTVCELDLFTSSPYIGISDGYYSAFNFPENGTFDSTCQSKSTLGWNQSIVDAVISHALSHPISTRQFVNLAVGFPSPQFSTFIDSAGISTSQLWDNPTLRSWIWNNTSYSTNFVLSTNGTSSTSIRSSSSPSSLSFGIIPFSPQIMSVVTLDMAISSISKFPD